MYYAVNYSNLSRRPGQMIGSQRMKIKGFKTQESLETWCYEHSDNCIGIPVWKPTDGKLKVGTYAMAGGTWHNVKNLDPSILAHI